MAMWIIYSLICLVLLTICLFILIKEKYKPKSLRTENELSEKFYNLKTRYEYLSLTKSVSNEKILILSSNKLKKTVFQEFLYSKIEYLLSLSKVIDEKLNSDKKTYRSKNGKILIEEIASVVASSIFLSDKCNLFEIYKTYLNVYKIKQKENKIFKLLLGQKLIYNLFDIEKEVIDISKIIIKSKSTKKIKKYKKQLYFLAEIYSIKKYNPNSTKILSNRKFNYNKIAKILFNELKESEKKEKIIISYLITMFS